MPSDKFELDDSDIAKLRADLAKYTDPKARMRITKAGLRGYAQPIVGEIRKAITATGSKKHGYLRKQIWAKTPKVFGDGNFWVVIGARPKKFPKPPSKGSNPAMYYHLVDGGTQPHYTHSGVNTRTSAGRFFGAQLTKMGEGPNHPGFKGRRIRQIGYDRGVPKATDKFLERFGKQDEREFKKATQSRSKLA